MDESAGNEAREDFRVRPPKLALNVAEAGEVLGIDRRLVTRLIDAGELPCIRVGRRRLIPLEGIKQFLSAGARRCDP